MCVIKCCNFVIMLNTQIYAYNEKMHTWQLDTCSKIYMKTKQRQCPICHRKVKKDVKVFFKQGMHIPNFMKIYNLILNTPLIPSKKIKIFFFKRNEILFY